MSPLANTTMEPPSMEVVESVIGLLRNGCPLTALQAMPGIEMTAAGWNDARALTTAARVAERTGGSALARQWHRLNYRRHPDDDVCFLYRLWDASSGMGIPRTLRLMEQRLKKPDLSPKRRADILLAGAGFLSVIRDFETANALMDEGLALRPADAWALACKASLLRRQDRREEALLVSQEALRLNPQHGASIETTADLLVELNRDDEAEQTLVSGCARTETADLRWQLYVFHSERENPDTALHWLEEYGRHVPLLPDKDKTAFHRARANLHLLRGDLESARTAAAACGDAYHDKMVKNLAAPGASTARRMRIPVGFVRQNHMTCGPATLAALAAYWGDAAPHLEIAEKICYDGTSAYSERTWAQERRLDGREFRVTAELTRELVARGIPFTLVTTWTSSAHLQAVIGTDDRAGLLIIRDPSFAHYSEAILEGFLAEYAAHGPRGMLVLPEGERQRTDGLLLPDAACYDLLHAVEGALQRHDRTLAQQHFERLCLEAPDHRLRWTAQTALAAYDDDPVKNHEAQTALARLFPDDAPTAWRAFRAGAARRTRGESLEELEKRIRDPRADTAFLSELARVLSEDARTVPRAKRLFTRLIRRNPGDAQSLTGMANCCWMERSFEDALAYYRLAACAADKNEAAASAFFNACRRMNRAEQGLVFLRRRAASFGHLSADPSITLANALDEMLRGEESLEVIRSAQKSRPADGALILHEAALHRTQGRFGDTALLLAKAKSLVPDQNWHRQSAALAQARGRTQEAMGHWRAVLEIEPLAMDAHEQLARLTAETEGPGKAVSLLRESTIRWPWHMGLARQLVHWLRRQDHPEAEAELRRILSHNPADDWAWRELSLELCRQSRHEEAITSAAESLRLSPQVASSHFIHGEALRTHGQRPEAHAAFRQALGLDISCGAMGVFLATAENAAEKRRGINYLRAELASQTGGGEAVSQFHAIALPHLTTEELTAILREGNRARPDIWETWSTLAEHLLNLQDPAALGTTREMTVRFPGVPGSWRLHSFACAQQGQPKERLAALERAVAISPQWSPGSRDLAELHEKEGRIDEAIREIRRMVAAQPLEPANHGVMADMLQRLGRYDEAVAALERAVELEPGYDWGWSALCSVCNKSKQPERAVTIARQLTGTRPDEPRSFIVLTEVLARLELFDEAMKTGDAAMARWPKNLRLHELRALIFKFKGKFAEAIEACQPAVFEGEIPRELRARRAAILMDAADYAPAERILEDLIESEPDYAWPRSLLYDLCRLRKDNNRCLSLARELVRIEPENAVAAGLLAESLTVAGKTDEAIVAVRRALELDPAYSYASGRLLEDLLKRRDFAAAREVTALMERFQKGPRTNVALARLAIAESRWKDAEELAVQIMETDESGADWAMSALAAAWPDAIGSAQDRLGPLVQSAVQEGRAKNASVSEVWVKLRRANNVYEDVMSAFALKVPRPVRDNIIRDLLYQASDMAFHAAALKTVKEHRDYLRGSTSLWGSVTYVLLNADRFRELLEWSADWPDRGDREPWIMSNIAIAHACENGPKAAAPAWREVLAAGSSGVWTQAASGLAFVDAVEGRHEESRHLLANLGGQPLSGQDQFSCRLAEAALAAGQAGPGRRSENRKGARFLLQRAADAWPGGEGTACGKHYLRDLQGYLFKNGLDPAFGRLPRAGSQLKPYQKIPPWAWIFVLVAVINMIRLCAPVSSSSDKSSPGSYRFPKEDPRVNLPTGPVKDGLPEKTATPLPTEPEKASPLRANPPADLKVPPLKF